ncbi:MAG: hypothetical protein L3K09_03510 [Thermoplasmata archaeon]|nr:hypothetical protein [Thermoplasmata archaeon]
MASITLAALGSKELAPQLGKKGTASDVTLYNLVRDGHAATIVEPTQFPEKLAPLLYAIAMADRALLSVPALNREVGETIAALALFDLPVDLYRGSGVGEEELRRALKGTRFERSPLPPLDVPTLREAIPGYTASPRDGFPIVRIDHAFPVKGVGAVALAVVRQGKLKAHAKMRLFPTEHVVEVRSIQVHDVDVREAATGERVGLALKGVEAEELSRGQLLAPEGGLSVGAKLECKSTVLSPYYRGRLSEGASVQLLLGLQFVPAKVEALKGDAMTLRADRPLAATWNEVALLADLSATGGSRIVGKTVVTTLTLA